MRQTKTLALVFFTSILYTHSQAQNNNTEIPYINSSDLIRNGIKAHDNGEYKKAISFYNQIPEGDTNYKWSLYENALSNLSDSNYDKSIELSKKAMLLKYQERRQLLLNLGTALDESGKTSEAVRLYDSVAKIFPHDNRPYYERAVVKFKAKDYTGAAVLLQQSLLINPLHFRSHYLLGSVYGLQGRLAESIMALNASLLCTSDVNEARNPISILSEVSKQTDEIADAYNNRKEEERDPAFDEIDEIIHAKLALNKGFQLKTEIDDVIFRQLQVVMEKLEYDSKDTNFAMQYYVPLFAKIYQENQFEPFVLQLFSDYGIKAIDKVGGTKKGKARLEGVRNIVYPYLGKIQSTRILNYKDRQKADELYHYYTEDKTLAVGKLADKEKGVFAAGFVQFYESQYLTAEGNYNANGKKDGIWNYYHYTGIPSRKEEYKNGVLVNDAISWYENGVVEKRMKSNSEGIETENKEYEHNGTLSSEALLKGKDEYEYTYYYPSGKMRKKLTFLNDKIKDGKCIIYFESGQKQKEFAYKNQKVDGLYVIYFKNGQIDETFNYQNDQIIGPYKSYFENGKPASEAIYVDGKKQGESVEYREDGSVYYKKNFNRGKVDGDVHYYNKEGKEYGTVTYKNDRVIRSRFFRPDGTEIVDKSVAEGNVSIYNEYGVLVRKMKIDKEGKLQDKASYYFSWGGLKEETHFKDDSKNGKSTYYHQNGKISSVRQYKNDTTDGYYQYYNELGKIKTEGWLKADVSQGIWRNYFDNGKISRDFYVVNDDLNGPDKNYEVNGKLDFINYYDRGMMVGFTQYDSTGKILLDVSFDKGNGKYKTVHQNGNPGLQCDLKYGQLNGAYTIHGGNKVLLEKGTYINNKADSDVETYFPNGKLKVKGFYADGDKNKTWTYYGYDGKVESITQFKNGNIDGKDSSFGGGRLASVATYRNDDLNGAYTVFGESGKVAGILYFDFGTLTGYSYEDKDGHLLPVQTVKNGSAHIQTTYANGSKAIDWTYEHNLLHGVQHHYFSNGQMAQEANYDNGNKEGAYKQFNPDGSMLSEYNYHENARQGNCKIYNNKGKPVFVVNYVDNQMNGKAQYTDEQGKAQIFWYYYGSVE